MRILISLSDDGIDRQDLSERNYGPFVVKKQIWSMPHDPEGATEIEAVYMPDGSYVGDKNFAYRLWREHGIVPEKATPDHNVCSIGWSERKKRWFGWSHRAIHGFKVGDKLDEGDCGYEDGGKLVAETLDDAKEMAKRFAKSVSADLSKNLSAAEAKTVIGARAFNQITKHPWYEKFCRATYPQVVAYRIVDDGHFYRVLCSSDGLRMVKWTVSKTLKTAAKESAVLYHWDGQSRLSNGQKQWDVKSTFSKD